MRRLYTFAISHFSEKARWALDHAGVDYEERRLLPGPHRFTVRKYGRKTSVPVWIDEDGAIQGSSAILDRVEAIGRRSLRPDDEARGRQLEQQADLAFGRGVQCIFYDVLLGRRDELIALWADGGPWWARGFYRVTFRALDRAVRRMYRIDEPGVAEAKQRFASLIAELDAHLAHHPYLVGDRFTRADLTVAALLAPMIRPPEHPFAFPELPQPLAEFATPFRGGPTWRHVERMYREHRR